MLIFEGRGKVRWGIRVAIGTGYLLICHFRVVPAQRFNLANGIPQIEVNRVAILVDATGSSAPLQCVDRLVLKRGGGKEKVNLGIAVVGTEVGDHHHNGVAV